MSTTAIPTNTKWWNGGRSPFNASYGKVMMWYFLMSDAFTFGAFLISYGTLRFSQNHWVDPNHVFNSFPFAGHADLPLAFVSIMTFILIISSVTMVMAVHKGHQMDQKGVEKYMLWTIVGGAAFLGCQAWEWTHLLTGEHAVWVNGQVEYWNTTVSRNPFGPEIAYPGTDPLFIGKEIATPGPIAFGSYFFEITGFHGFHVLSGVVINIIMYIKTKMSHFQQRGHYEMIEKAGLYWHFVDLVWVFVFLCFYLI
jgi:cytochrome c oxidase subunit 3